VPPDRRTHREIRSANAEMKHYQYETGQWVQWFRFNQPATTSDPVYGTGPQRVWFPSVTVPCYISEYQRSGQNFDDQGLYLVDRLHLIISYSAWWHTNMPDPDPFRQDHTNDRVGYSSTLFAVDTFYPQGKVGNSFLTISCDLREVAAEEMLEDVPVPMFAEYFTAS
jgi:hypothetical protein